MGWLVILWEDQSLKLKRIDTDTLIIFMSISSYFSNDIMESVAVYDISQYSNLEHLRDKI